MLIDKYLNPKWAMIENIFKGLVYDPSADPEPSSDPEFTPYDS